VPDIDPCLRLSLSVSLSVHLSLILMSSSKGAVKGVPAREKTLRTDRQPALYYLSNYTELDYSAKRRPLPRAELPAEG